MRWQSLGEPHGKGVEEIKVSFQTGFEGVDSG